MKKFKITKSIVACATVALAVTSCQAIPTSGPIQEGLSVFSQTQQQVIYRPEMPIPDANPEEIVTGFLRAASSAADDYGIARQFLTKKYSTNWDPYQSVTIDESSRSYTLTNSNQVKLSLTTTGTVDSRGVLRLSQPNTITEVAFELSRENGEWRISSAPNGVILDRTTFKDVWLQQNIYFWDQDGNLVADPRWFLNRGTLPTQVITEMLEGPRPELVGALNSSILQGTQLTSEAVIVESGVATIDFSKDFLNSNLQTLRDVEAQLGALFYSVAGVNSFVVRVDQAEVLRGGVVPAQNYQPANPVGLASWAGAVIDGKFGFLSPTGFVEDEVLGNLIAPLEIKQMVMRGGQRDMLVLAEGSKLFWVSSQEGAILVDGRPGLSSPSFDRFGYVWSYATSEPELIAIGQLNLELEPLQIPWLAQLNVRQIKVSPDGMKLALLAKESNNWSLYITGISRSATGEVKLIVQPDETPAFWSTEQVVDFDWVDAQKVGLLLRGDPPQSSSKILIGGLGIFTEERPGVQDSLLIRGSTRASSIQLLDKYGLLWNTQGSIGWQKQNQEVEIISKRG